MTAYYNEIDPYAAQWLRNLIAKGHIDAGEVDERSIEDVRPDDLRGFTQCHFFAGIGGWPLALRRAGWPDDRPVWSGSAPCQPFSQAGEGLGFSDQRHLWPYFHWLIAQCRPADVTGEQVASKNVDDWIDLVQSDMEALGYAFGSVPFPSAGVGAPHIRDRNFWLAHADHARSQGRKRVRERATERSAGSGGVVGILDHDHDHGRAAPSCGRVRDAEHDAQSRSRTGILADADISIGAQGSPIDGRCDSRGDALARARPCGVCLSCKLANTNLQPGRPEHERKSRGRREGPAHIAESGCDGEEPVAGPTNGFWRSADWLFCRDEKWRPVEPGTFPLAYGLPAGMGKLSPELLRLASVAGLDAASLKRAKSYRVGTLRGYGNAINIEAAAEFIRAAREAIEL